MNIQDEINRRERMWYSLIEQGGPDKVTSRLVREIGMYSGAQGIYRDAVRTSAIALPGVTVGILHTGRHYPDDISETEIIYHYPATRRAANTDLNEIEATKNAGKLGIPIFIITEVGNLRDVRIGMITSWDDISKTFLIKFHKDITPGPSIIEEQQDEIDSEFISTVARRKRISTTTTSRPGQTKFKFDVIKRYGTRCAVCPVNVYSMLQAAHIIPVEKNGTDDPRNGLVLCSNHHTVFDQNLFTINPDSLLVEIITGNKEALFITRDDITHLPHLPHNQALTWRYRRFQERAGT